MISKTLATDLATLIKYVRMKNEGCAKNAYTEEIPNMQFADTSAVNEGL